MAEGMKPPEGAGKGGPIAGDGREATSGDWASIAAAVGQQAISMLVDGQPQAFVDFFYLACQREEGKECAARPPPPPPPRPAPPRPAPPGRALPPRDALLPWPGRPPRPPPPGPPGHGSVSGGRRVPCRRARARGGG